VQRDRFATRLKRIAAHAPLPHAYRRGETGRCGRERCSLPQQPAVARSQCGSAACSAMGLPHDRKASRRTRRCHRAIGAARPVAAVASVARSYSSPQSREANVGALRAARWGCRTIEKHRGACAAATGLSGRRDRSLRSRALLAPTAGRDRAKPMWERCVQRDGAAARSKSIAARAPLPQGGGPAGRGFSRAPRGPRRDAFRRARDHRARTTRSACARAAGWAARPPPSCVAPGGCGPR